MIPIFSPLYPDLSLLFLWINLIDPYIFSPLLYHDLSLLFLWINLIDPYIFFPLLWFIPLVFGITLINSYFSCCLPWWIFFVAITLINSYFFLILPRLTLNLQVFTLTDSLSVVFPDWSIMYSWITLIDPCVFCLFILIGPYFLDYPDWFLLFL